MEKGGHYLKLNLGTLKTVTVFIMCFPIGKLMEYNWRFCL